MRLTVSCCVRQHNGTTAYRCHVSLVEQPPIEQVTRLALPSMNTIHPQHARTWQRITGSRGTPQRWRIARRVVLYDEQRQPIRVWIRPAAHPFVYAELHEVTIWLGHCGGKREEVCKNVVRWIRCRHFLVRICIAPGDGGVCCIFILADNLIGVRCCYKSHVQILLLS